MNESSAIFRMAAQRVTDELDARGFYTDCPGNAQGLVNKLEEIIRETIQGNANFTRAAEIDGDGWEGDLQNQIS